MGTAKAVQTQSNQPTSIGLVADGTQLTLYLNATRVACLPGVYTRLVDLTINGFDTNGNLAEVVYSDAHLWSL